MNSLDVKDLRVAVNNKEVIHNVSLTVEAGTIHALVGPNGSGKSSLAYAIAGHGEYIVAGGNILLDGNSVVGLTPEARAKQGLFLSFQEPPVVGGVALRSFLRTIGSNVEDALPKLKLEDSFLSRYLNDGFSGGEKKKSEVLQLLARKPKIAILDELDTGLDTDAFQGVIGLLKTIVQAGTGLLVISHSTRLFKELVPDQVHVLVDGRIVREGNAEILEAIAKNGYGQFQE
ncbi:MAG: ABC transporter ATP-binding protein [bacterium]